MWDGVLVVRQSRHFDAARANTGSRTQVHKWGMLGRTATLDSLSAVAVNSIIKRASMTSPSTVIFATSLIEWCLLNKMHLTELPPGYRALSNPTCHSLLYRLQLTHSRRYGSGTNWRHLLGRCIYTGQRLTHGSPDASPISIAPVRS